MGRIRTLQVAGYRSVRDEISITFPEKMPIVLVGENNSGKSNIVRALDLILGESWPGSYTPDDHDYFGRDRANGSIEIIAELSGVKHKGSGWEDWVEKLTWKGKINAATNCVGTIGGELVVHVAVSSAFHQGGRHRASRLVVVPEWQVAGVGMRSFNHVCERCLRGQNRFGRPGRDARPASRPRLCAALHRDSICAQKSARLLGSSLVRIARSLTRAARKRGGSEIGAGLGGHLRAVQGFKYVGSHAGEARWSASARRRRASLTTAAADG